MKVSIAIFTATRQLRRPILAIPRITGHRRYAVPYGYALARALVFADHGQPSDVLKLHSYSIPPAYGDSITVKFLAAPINPADINQIEGTYPAKPPFTTALGTPTASAIPGNEGVVEIVGLGSTASPDGSLKKGDWAVMSASKFGTWRTYASAKASDLLKINKDGITAVQAGTVSVNPCTAYRMLKDFAEMKEGDWFIQNGANSGVGRAAIQFGKIWGFKSINVVRARPDLEGLKKDLEGLGADLVVTDEELAERSIKEIVAKATCGNAIKLGLNCVGGSAASNLVNQLGYGAHIVTYGAMSKKPLNFAASAFIFKDIHAHGFWVSAWSDKHPEEKKKMLDSIFEWTRKGEFKDAPMQLCEWTDSTEIGTLLETVNKGISGFAGKKGVFVMTNT